MELKQKISIIWGRVLREQHLLSFLIFICFNIYISLAWYPLKAGILRLVFLMIFNGSIYIFCYSILVDKLFEKQKYLLLFCCMIGIILASSFFRFGAEILIYRNYVVPVNPSLKPPPFVFIRLLLAQGLVVFISTLLGIIKNKFVSEKRIIELNKIKVETELSLLKAKINPHFLLNTLNNIYYYSRKEESKSSESIVQLSHLLQYTIYETSFKKITLEREMEIIKDLLQLYNLRFETPPDITVDIDESAIIGIEIPPATLLIIVENALKHSGIGHEKNSFIKLSVKPTEEDLTINLTNSISPYREKTPTVYSGLGLTSLQQILSIEYPEQHTLQVYCENNIYYTNITLKI